MINLAKKIMTCLIALSFALSNTVYGLQDKPTLRAISTSISFVTDDLIKTVTSEYIQAFVLQEDDIALIEERVISLFSRILTQDWRELLKRTSKTVNPDAKPLRGLYIASGPDISTFMLLSNAENGYFITKDNLKGEVRFTDAEELERYVIDKSKDKPMKAIGSVFTMDDYLLGINRDILAPLIWELLGIGATNIKILKNKTYPNVYKISFNWQHPLDKKSTQRVITFFSDTDLNDVQKYLPLLSGEFDFFLEKGLSAVSYHISGVYRKELLKFLVDQGLIITDDSYSWRRSGMQPGEQETTVHIMMTESREIYNECPEAANFGHGILVLLRYDPAYQEQIKEQSWSTLINNIQASSLDVISMEYAKEILMRAQELDREKMIIELLSRFGEYYSHRDTFKYASLCVFIAMIADLIPRKLIFSVENIQKQGNYHYDSYDEGNDDGVFELTRALALDVINKVHYGKDTGLFARELKAENYYYGNAVEYALEAARLLKFNLPETDKSSSAGRQQEAQKTIAEIRALNKAIYKGDSLHIRNISPNLGWIGSEEFSEFSDELDKLFLDLIEYRQNVARIPIRFRDITAEDRSLNDLSVGKTVVLQGKEFFIKEKLSSRWSSVFIAHDNQENKDVILKTPSSYKRDLPWYASQELIVLLYVNHPNAISGYPLFRRFKEEGRERIHRDIIFVEEYHPNSLVDIELTDERIFEIMHTIIAAQIALFNQVGFMQGDLKANNIRISISGQPVLIDFGEESEGMFGGLSEKALTIILFLLLAVKDDPDIKRPAYGGQDAMNNTLNHWIHELIADYIEVPQLGQFAGYYKFSESNMLFYAKEFAQKRGLNREQIRKVEKIAESLLKDESASSVQEYAERYKNKLNQLDNIFSEGRLQEGLLLDGLRRLAKHVVEDNNLLEDSYKQQFASDLDNVKHHDPKWHQWGIITHTKKCLELFRYDLAIVPLIYGLCNLHKHYEQYLTQEIDGRSKEYLLEFAILLHDIGKFRKQPKQKGGFIFRGHAAISKELILDKDQPIYKWLSETYGLTDRQINYIAEVAGLHYVLGEIRNLAEHSKHGYTIRFTSSDDFTGMIRGIMDKHEEYKVEIELLFLIDSLAKTDIFIYAEKYRDIDKEKIKQAMEEINSRGLNPDLIEAVKEVPINIAVAKEYFIELVSNADDAGTKASSAGTEDIVLKDLSDYDAQHYMTDFMLRYAPTGIIEVPKDSQAIVVYSDALKESPALQDIIRKSAGDNRRFYLVNKEDIVSDALLAELNIDKNIFERHVFYQNSMSPEQLALTIAGTLHNQNIKQGRVFASTEEDLSAWSRQGIIEALVMLLKDKRFEIISDYSEKHIEYIRTYEQALIAA